MTTDRLAGEKRTVTLVPPHSDIFGGGLDCPVCGFNYTHIDSVTVHPASFSENDAIQVCAVGEDEQSRVFHVVDTQTKRQYTRRHAIVLHGTCENYCVFSITFSQHKGMTSTFWEGLTRQEWVMKEHGMNEVEAMFWVAACNMKFVDEPWGMSPQMWVDANGESYRVDFGQPDQKIAIEIDGLAYHNGQDSFMRDRKRQRDLELAGWRVIRFAAKEIMEDSLKCVFAADAHIKAIMGERGEVSL